MREEKAENRLTPDSQQDSERKEQIRRRRAAIAKPQIVKPQIKDVPYQVNEALNILRGNIEMSGYNLKVIAVTSARSHEGKSSIAFRLAKNLAGLKKKVLYIDGDIRNSRVMLRYGIQGEYRGLSEYLCGRVSKERIIFHTDDPWMDMVFAGAVAPDPSVLFSGEMFKEFISYARELYEWVIVDTPPLNAVIDGLLIAKQCDGAILVVECGLTERVQAEKARKQLLYADVQILGAVLNKVHMNKHRYGYGYGYGYGEKKEKQSDGEGKKKGKRRTKKKEKE